MARRNHGHAIHCPVDTFRSVSIISVFGLDELIQAMNSFVHVSAARFAWLVTFAQVSPFSVTFICNEIIWYIFLSFLIQWNCFCFSLFSLISRRHIYRQPNNKKAIFIRSLKCNLICQHLQLQQPLQNRCQLLICHQRHRRYLNTILSYFTFDTLKSLIKKYILIIIS